MIGTQQSTIRLNSMNIISNKLIELQHHLRLPDAVIFFLNPGNPDLLSLQSFRILLQEQ
jgi:hypothetical protein